jgi:hypothetical protein
MDENMINEGVEYMPNGCGKIVTQTKEQKPKIRLKRAS